jgi:hypothetical protein
MRAAIKKCANPHIQHKISSIVNNPHADTRDRTEVIKEFARDELHGRGSKGFLLTCDECGELKDEKVLKRCGAW